MSRPNGAGRGTHSPKVIPHAVDLERHTRFVLAMSHDVRQEEAVQISGSSRGPDIPGYREGAPPKVRVDGFDPSVGGIRREVRIDHRAVQATLNVVVWSPEGRKVEVIPTTI